MKCSIMLKCLTRSLRARSPKPNMLRRVACSALGLQRLALAGSSCSFATVTQVPQDYALAMKKADELTSNTVKPQDKEVGLCAGVPLETFKRPVRAHVHGCSCLHVLYRNAACTLRIGSLGARICASSCLHGDLRYACRLASTFRQGRPRRYASVALVWPEAMPGEAMPADLDCHANLCLCTMHSS